MSRTKKKVPRALGGELGKKGGTHLFLFALQPRFVLRRKKYYQGVLQKNLVMKLRLFEDEGWEVTGVISYRALHK